MRKELKTIILLLLLGVFLIPVYPNSQNTKDDTRHIDLEQEKGGTRSGTDTDITAYIDGDILTVGAKNYTNSYIQVEIFDDYGNPKAFAESVCDTYVVMDISSLQPGQYEIVVIMDYRYTGSFER